MMLNGFNWFKNNCSDSPTSLPMFCKPRTQIIKGEEFLTCLPTPQLLWANSSPSRNRDITRFLLCPRKGTLRSVKWFAQDLGRRCSLT